MPLSCVLRRFAAFVTQKRSQPRLAVFLLGCRFVDVQMHLLRQRRVLGRLAHCLSFQLLHPSIELRNSIQKQFRKGQHHRSHFGFRAGRNRDGLDVRGHQIASAAMPQIPPTCLLMKQDRLAPAESGAQAGEPNVCRRKNLAVGILRVCPPDLDSTVTISLSGKSS